MIKRHEVQVLLAAGHSHRRVAGETGVSKRSVERIAPFLTRLLRTSGK